MYDDDNEIGTNKFFRGISFIFFPIATNLALLLFLIFSIDLYVPASSATNVIGTIGFFVYYLGCFFLFLAYAKSTNGLFDLFGSSFNTFLIIIIIITYPIFFLFWLPYIIYQLLVYAGTPKAIWEKIFAGTFFSLENLYPEFCSNTCQLVGRYIYIGFPFFLFALIYICIIIFLSPLWYYVLSPIGFGTLGICLHVSLRFPHSTEFDLVQRTQKSYTLGIFVHTYAIALPCIILGACYVAFVGSRWHAIFLLVMTCLHFAVDAIPSAIGISRGRQYSVNNIYL